MFGAFLRTFSGVLLQNGMRELGSQRARVTAPQHGHVWRIAARASSGRSAASAGTGFGVQKLSPAEEKRLQRVREQGEAKRRSYSLGKEQARQAPGSLEVLLGSANEDRIPRSLPASDFEDASLRPAQSQSDASGESSGAGSEPAKSFEQAPPDVFLVSTAAQAQRVAALLSSKYRGNVHACDTEVAQIDVKTMSPVEHGRMTCFSLFCGEGAHFGLGPGPAGGGERQNKVWVDLLDCDDREAILTAFRPFFEDSAIKKIWHNYGFDKHIFGNEGIRCAGFHGDTMHMARLWDSSRTINGGYSLESLSSDSKLMGKKSALFKKTSMKEIFGKPNIKKDNTPGKLIIIPPVETIQREEETRGKWIKYSVMDSQSTWYLHSALEKALIEVDAEGDGVDMLATFGDLANHSSRFTMLDFYRSFWQPFGSLLTDMEHEGLLVDVPHLKKVEEVAVAEQALAKQFFRDWAKQKVPDASMANVGSSLQIRQLFFAGARNSKQANESVDLVRTFKAPNEHGFIEEGKKKPKKNVDIELYGLWGKGKPSRLQVEHYTATGWPAASTTVLRSLAGKAGRARELLEKVEEEEGNERQVPAGPLAKAKNIEEEMEELGLGKAYVAFGGGQEGIRACAATDALCDVAAIDTLLSNFIIPLQGDTIKCAGGRVHCSMNINTETGRLSARRPNLQNQPALEKDRYKIRQAFTADVAAGKTLVVADYGQLELRLLAHMTNCKSMLEAFSKGGDFHSRTALSMYDHIQEAVAKGECLLEWDGGVQGEEPPAPLIKDMFSAERRKAKILNFSIAYGKTAHGLAKDWQVSLREAEETVLRWYRDRPEVKEWQEQTTVEAHQMKAVRTLLGRRRHLHQINSRQAGVRSHYERAAINTPIQGGAADIAMLAMLEIDSCPELRELGWRLLLQVHDEVMLEGPRESKNEALALVRRCMENPFRGKNPLLVDLSVDAKSSDTWYGAK